MSFALAFRFLLTSISKLRMTGAVTDKKQTTIRTLTTHKITNAMMLKGKEEDSVHSKTSGMKYLSIWDDGESSSPFMDQTNSSLNSPSDHSSTFSLRQTPPSSPTKRIHKGHGDDTRRQTLKRNIGREYQLKNARDALIGSISAVINFLRTSGVPKPACDQLNKNLEMGRYFAVMKRVQDYIQCLPSSVEDEVMAKIHLAVTAWETLCRFKTIEYKRAYKLSFNLRYEVKGTPWEIKSAIDAQIKLAEQCTACQKKLYLVQKWQRHQLQKMKRTTMIEPQGYQPIRCM